MNKAELPARRDCLPAPSVSGNRKGAIFRCRYSCQSPLYIRCGALSKARHEVLQDMPRYNLTALRLYIGALAGSRLLPVRCSQARTISSIITNDFHGTRNDRTKHCFRREENSIHRGQGNAPTEGRDPGAGPTVRHDREQLSAGTGIRLHATCKAHPQGGRPAAGAGRLSLRPGQVHLGASRNVHKSAAHSVQPGSFHGRMVP